jgi:putative membrane protein
MWSHNWSLGWGWTLFGSIMMVAFWGALVWLFVELARGAGPGSRTRDEGPKEIADRRLARGELTLEEHERIVARLKG